MKTIVDVVKVDKSGAYLKCPICGETLQHGGPAFLVDAAYLGADPVVGPGIYLPFVGECGHRWGIGIAHDGGAEYVHVLLTPTSPLDDRPASWPRWRAWRDNQKGDGA